MSNNQNSQTATTATTIGEQQPPQPQTQTQTQPSTTSALFAQLRSSIVEHSSGEFLRLKENESQVVTVLVRPDPDPAKATPRECRVLPILRISNG